jgi:hypothetical protein
MSFDDVINFTKKASSLPVLFILLRLVTPDKYPSSVLVIELDDIFLFISHNNTLLAVNPVKLTPVNTGVSDVVKPDTLDWFKF